VPTAAALDLLHVLTVADGLATGPAVGSEWRTGLVDALVARVRARLAGAPPLAPRPQPAERLREAARPLGPDGVGVGVRTEDGGYTVTVVAPDRKGLMAGVAGVLALHRLSVRSADLRTEGGTALDEWRVVPEYGDPPARDALREDVRRVLAGRYDVGAVLARREAGRARPLRRLAGGLGGDAGARDGGTSERLPPQVDVVPDASEAATVLEVRAADRLGLLHQLGAALAVAGVVVRAARVTTLGAEAVDVFYVVDGSGRPLAPERARVVADLLGEAAR
jgi:[protein-PII] uridylyltransferase